MYIIVLLRLGSKKSIWIQIMVRIRKKCIFLNAMSGAMIFLNCVLPFVGERMICKKKTMDMSGYSCVCVKIHFLPWRENINLLYPLHPWKSETKILIIYKVVELLLYPFWIWVVWTFEIFVFDGSKPREIWCRLDKYIFQVVLFQRRLEVVSIFLQWLHIL